MLKQTEQRYLKYGLGIERDTELNGKESYMNDVLDLAQELKETAPPTTGPITLLHSMFQIGFRTGVRSERMKRKR